MTFIELTKAVSEIIPKAAIGQGVNGEVIIYTNLKVPERENDPLEELPVLEEDVFSEGADQ